ASRKLPMKVKTLFSESGTSPKKLGMNPNSASTPNRPPTAPTPMPQLRFLSSQFEIDGQPESPPKLYPMKGLMKPSARAGSALAMEINSVRNRVETVFRAVGDISSITSFPREMQKPARPRRQAVMIAVTVVRY